MLKDEISKTVWDLKYRYRLNGVIIDQTLEDTWQRVAKAIASAEKGANRAHWQQQFYRILENFRFLPGGRILAGAGTKHKVTLFNCFVMDIAKDSLPAIFKALAEGANTLHQGGGVGYDFSLLRPAGDIIKQTGMIASGPISFMRIWNTMCSVLLSTGARRGAMMGVLRCDHPDILAFIEAKKDPNALRHFNVSVMVSDAFMQAVKKDADWPLIFPAKDGRVYHSIKACLLWEKIIQSTYDYAEPGVLFGDTINRLNNLNYCEEIKATNPCGEIPLPAYGACDLGAINLSQFVLFPFSEKAKLDWAGLEETVKIATRFLDNVIDVSHYPLKVQQHKAYATRRIGLGITGLADVFVMLGIPYGSQPSIELAAKIMQHIATATWQTSIDLAKEKGKFPCFTADYLQGEFVQQLAPAIQNDLAKYGVRNSHHNTIAPTGTISLLANNVSNGIEPIFRAKYNRHVRSKEDKPLTFSVQNYAYRLWQETKGTSQLPPAWVDTETLMPADHLAMLSAVQPFIDNAISKTINIPKDFPFEKLADVYTRAYELGLKGCTIFRPNPITGNVIEVPEEFCCQHESE